ncbi:23S rRNA (uracil(1939)-C(5))-methyltransferase RlmD [Succinimonas amylolytica]|uniref:23S rRNA (uracil(1939)-C(5))-methyltransferase RlmD n=1 Tax=Succinimonas amylolytica TaxID=83769 RepID=UPI0003808C92|nr:23S rRNA (uracil(1939)-C(5))-methyltransferase RlmD [Succinimonas amylolytica]
MVKFYKPEAKKVSPKHFSVVISDVDIKGKGIGKKDGVTWFVSGALPGEEVVVREISRKGSTGEAELISILTRSSDRQQPVCRYYEKCGGCSLQHMSASQELSCKVNGIKRLMNKVFRLDIPEPDKIEGSAKYGYRRSLRLSVQGDRREIHMGFRQEKNSRIVEIDECPVLKEGLSRLITPLRETLARLSNFKLIGHLELVSGDNGTALLVRTINLLPAGDEEIFRDFGNREHVAVYLQIRHEKGREELFQREELKALNPEILEGGRLWYNDAGVKVFFTPGDFIQINAEMNARMVAAVTDYLEPTLDDEIWDLFSGAGNFALALAGKVKHVYGVEVVRNMVYEARLNAETLGISNAEFILQDLSDDFAKTVWAKSQVNKVLLDPGRQGADRVMQHLIRKNVPRVVYVSCNPLTMIRDLKPLLDNGYIFEKWSAFNMFPNTEHVETVVLLSRAK